MDPSWTVTREAAGLRLDKFLSDENRLGSRRRATSAVRCGKVFVNDAEVTADLVGARLDEGDIVRVWIDRPGSARRAASATLPPIDAEVVYEDHLLLVLNKPAGLLTVPLDRPGGRFSVYEQLDLHLRARKQRAFVVHRIDRDTSGLVVFAKDRDTQQALKSQFKRREPERVYWTVVHGHPRPASGRWIDHLVWDARTLRQKGTRAGDRRSKEAICDYSILEAFDDASLLEVRLHTGKRNQIRIQSQLHGHPIVGERRYVTDAQPASARLTFARQALHAHRLAFRHPASERELGFEAPLPADFADLLARLRRRSR